MRNLSCRLTRFFLPPRGVSLFAKSRGTRAPADGSDTLCEELRRRTEQREGTESVNPARTGGSGGREEAEPAVTRQRQGNDVWRSRLREVSAAHGSRLRLKASTCTARCSRRRAPRKN